MLLRVTLISLTIGLAFSAALTIGLAFSVPASHQAPPSVQKCAPVIACDTL